MLGSSDLVIMIFEDIPGNQKDVVYFNNIVDGLVNVSAKFSKFLVYLTYLKTRSIAL